MDDAEDKEYEFGPRGRRMRILYIDCDSLRPDHLGCYGYDRDTSPNIDRLASEGRRFTNYYVSDAPCLPSRTALFASRFGVHTGVVDHGGRHATPRRQGSRGFRTDPRYASWPRALSRAGVHTASVSPFPSRHDAWHVLEGFEEYHDTGKNGHELAAEVYDVAEEWLAAHASDDDWFLHVNFWDPHKPYDVPEEYGNPFADDPPPGWLTAERIDAHRRQYGPHSAGNPQSKGADWGDTWDLPRMPEAIASREDFDRWIDGYDVGIRYMDDHVGLLLDLLSAAGVRDETLVVLSADHGENHGELNVYGDHHTADDKTCRVPLVMEGPHVESGVDSGLHYHVDLAPTVMDLCGEEPPAGWDGQSFAGGGVADGECGREFLVTSQGAWACQRGVRWDDWLLLVSDDHGMKEALDNVMLFDLATDPHETTNLADDRPGVVETGRALLGRWLDDRLHETARGENGGDAEAEGGTADPLREVLREGGPFHTRGRAKPYANYLRSVGRADQAERLERRQGIEP
jgi:arylsulfatase A-like enzyme